MGTNSVYQDPSLVASAMLDLSLLGGGLFVFLRLQLFRFDVAAGQAGVLKLVLKTINCVISL